MKVPILQILCLLLLTPRVTAGWFMSDSGTLSLPKEDGAAFNADDFSRAVADLKEKGKLAEMTRLGVGSLLGEDAFHDELMQVMKHRMPKETAALLKSSGNMHNPAVTAFYRDFGDLLLATPSFRKMNEVLAGVSRTIGQPDFEKLSYTKGEDGKRRFWCVLWVPVLGPDLPADTPLLFRQRDFTCAALAEAVNHFVKLGPVQAEEALKNLLAVAAIRPREEFDVAERAAWICRVLYQPAGDAPLRDIRSGGVSLPYLSMPLARWPLYPLARSGDSLFVLDEGRMLGGRAESLPNYIAWCRTHGVWLNKPLPVPDRGSALRDARNLRAGAAWKAIRWKDKEHGSSYTYSEERCWKWIEQQAERIPEPAPQGESGAQK